MAIQSAKAAVFKTREGAVKRMRHENAMDKADANRAGRAAPIRPWCVVPVNTGNSSMKRYRLERLAATIHDTPINTDPSWRPPHAQ